MRRRLPAGVRMYTGDDFNYPELIAGDDEGYSARPARHLRRDRAGGRARAWPARAQATGPGFHAHLRARPCRCRATSSRRRRASTRPASSSWPSSTATRTISPWSAVSRARARPCIWPSCSGWPTHAGLFADPDAGRRPGAAGLRRARRGGLTCRLPTGLSLNTATVREQVDASPTASRAARVTASAASRPGATSCTKWARRRPPGAIRDAGLEVTGLCRGGWFTAEGALTASGAATTTGARSTRRPRSGRACLVLVVGGLPEGSRDLDGARATVEDGLADRSTTRAAQGVKVAIEPLHPMYAADRACVNTLEQALDLCDRLGDGIGVAVRRLSRLVGPRAQGADRARRAASGCWPSTSATGWCRPATC